MFLALKQRWDTLDPILRGFLAGAFAILLLVVLTEGYYFSKQASRATHTAQTLSCQRSNELRVADNAKYVALARYIQTDIAARRKEELLSTTPRALVIIDADQLAAWAILVSQIREPLQILQCPK